MQAADKDGYLRDIGRWSGAALLQGLFFLLISDLCGAVEDVGVGCTDNLGGREGVERRCG